MIERLQTLLKTAEESILGAADLKVIDEIRVKYLGKSGELTEILKGLSQVSAEDRPKVGKVSNEIKNKIAELLDQKREDLESKSSQAVIPGWDPTLPGRKLDMGKMHPLVAVQKEIAEIFKNLGFDIAEGPDLETDYYNFLALNFPPDHPARDAQDTFYVKNKVLRTHTSPIQVREMEKRKPPFKFIAPGRVYRNEAIDATHHHIFHQVEGFLVDEGVQFSHLKGVLDVFIKKFFGADVKTRFRPSFFPFTEPSAEMDISCVFCKGQGCRICKQSGWVEMMGCGMIDPVVLKNCGIDDEKYSGFAFGMGVERIALFKYGIDDIRLFYQNDIRFLDEF
ncbi:MAG TPA: phenylalanine--tRNA ligase subunit alpha [bacterium]|nr:phenylalanine--tRNA ligase subunit alpha [bacterium]